MRNLKRCFFLWQAFCFFFLLLSCETFKKETAPTSLRFQAILDRFKLKIPQKASLIEVTYLDYFGAPQKGSVEALARDKIRVKTFFDQLYQKKFRFSQVKPISSFDQDVEKALSLNATFALVQTNDLGHERLVLMINPVTNPSVLKMNHVILEKTYNLAVWPAQGIFALRNTGKGSSQRSGIITRDVSEFLTQQNVIRLDDGKNDILNFGLYVFDPESSELKQSGDKASTALLGAEEQKDHSAPCLQNPLKSVSLAYSDEEEDFSYGPLPEDVKKELIDNKTWTPNCPLALERFSLVTFKHYDSQGEVKSRVKLIVVDVAGEAVMNLLKELFQQRYPINLIFSFNCRSVTGRSCHYSLHAYGTAIDINYDTNPYVGLYQISSDGLYSGATLIPGYVGLSLLDHNFIHPSFNEKLVSKMRQIGFYQWGGDWYTPTDYMHFQTSRFITEMLPSLDVDSGKKLFFLGAKLSIKALDKLSDVSLWQSLYSSYPSRFADVVVAQSKQLETVEDEYEFFEIVLNQLSSHSSPLIK